MNHRVNVLARVSGKFAFEIIGPEGNAAECSRFNYGSYDTAYEAGLKRAARWDERTKEIVS